MTLTHESVVHEARAAPPRPRRRWPWLVAAILVVVFAVAGGTWWLLESTVPVSDYDEVVDEVVAAEEALETAEAEVAGLQSDVESLTAGNAQVADDLADAQSRAAALAADTAAMRTAIVSAVAAAEAHATEQINVFSDYAVEVQEAGADLTLADDLLADLGRDETFVEWAVEMAAGDPWLHANRSMLEVDDETLSDAWTTWSYAEFGSAEDLASYWEFQWRLSHLILGPLLEVETSLEDLAAVTPTA